MKSIQSENVTSVSSEAIRVFRKKVYGYFAKAGRNLPWRNTSDPYHILVSEIMLQQTQVDRVIEKYLAFVKSFPDFKALDRASFKKVYGIWQGLGYNRRALALKRTAGIVLEKFNGKLPASESELLALPGIGKTTAASICAFAFNLPTLFIETNIRTVFIHHFFQNQTAVSDSEIVLLLEKTIDKKEPKKWYSALMDYGTVLKKKHQNPSRKSSNYSRQSAFKGSRREIRGALLKILLGSLPRNIHEIVRELRVKEVKIVKQILQEMTGEGLLAIKGNRYTIA